MDNKNKRRIIKYIDLSTMLGFIGSVAGALATIYASIKTEANGFVTVFIVSVVMETIILLMWAFCLYEKFRHKIKEDELKANIEASKEECIKIRAEVDEKLKELDTDHENVIRHLSTISASIKNNSIHNNELLVR